MKARKIPVEVETIQWRDKNDTPRLLNWLAQQNATLTGWSFSEFRISVPTPEGTTIATPGDWIIKGGKGEYYACKPDIFAMTYELNDAGPRLVVVHDYGQ